ncbi:MAG: hypothetical protein IKE73_04015 [Bacilli bacterium]|nr:hypothetical protein [Bacilli bacterium]
MNKEIKNIDLQLLSSIIFICASIISLTITIDEKLIQENKKNIYTKNEALNLSIINRIVILVSIFISLYVSYTNYKNSLKEREKYKTSLLLFTNILTLISGIIILYISIINKNEDTLSAGDTQNTLI